MMASHLSRWCTTLPAALGASHWPGVFVALLAFLLLLAFHQVVSSNVQTSALRHRANALYDKASAHCKTMADHSAREVCFADAKVQVSQSTVPTS